MKSQKGFYGRSFVVSVGINAVLCAAIGAVLGGLPGGQLGLAMGIALAVLPTIVRALAARLARPDALPRLIAREVAAVAIRIGSAVASALARLFGPVARLLQGPLLLGRFTALIVAGLVSALLAAAGRVLGTPLGFANLCALGVIVLNIAGFEYAAPVAFVGLVLLILTLLVSENEAAGQLPSPHQTDSHGAST